MPINLTCQCGKSARVRDELEGKKVKCPGCGAAILVPRRSGDAGVPVAQSGEPAAEKPYSLADEDPYKLADGGDDSTSDQEMSLAPPKRTANRRSRSSRAMVWSFPDSAEDSNNFYALSSDLFCIASLPKKKHQVAREKLETGGDPETVMGDQATIVRLADLTSIQANHGSSDMIIRYSKNTKTRKKTLTFPDAEERDDVFDALKHELGSEWSLASRGESRLAILLATGGGMLAILIFTLLCYFAVGVDEDTQRTRKARGLAAIVNFLGRPGVLIIGGLGFLACGGYLAWTLYTAPPLRKVLTRR